MTVTVHYTGRQVNSNGAAQAPGGNGKSPPGAPLLAAALNALALSVAIVDARGFIVAVNDTWRRYADDNGLRWRGCGIGYNYLAALDNAARDGDAGVAQIALGIRRVLDGTTQSFRAEYPCEIPGGCQFIQDVSAFDYAGARHALISHENVTFNRIKTDELRAAKQAAETARRAEQLRRESAENRLRISQAVADMLAIASSGLQLEDALQRMVERGSQTFGSQAAAIYRAEEHWDRPILLAACGEARYTARSPKLLVAPAILARAVGDKRGIAMSDVLQDHGVSAPRARTSGRTPDYRALLVTPIHRRDQFYGYLVQFFAEPREFSEDDLELARLFSQQVTVALENAELRAQSEKTAIENERNRLARELHDAVTQTLFSASVVAEALPRVWERDPAKGRQALEELRLWTRGALAEMRTLLMELRPSALIDKPLPDLIRQLGDAASTRLSIPAVCRVAAEAEPPADVKLSLYRIAQEALNNVVKHACAAHVEINYLALPQVMQLVISDDGRGFDLGQHSRGQMGLGIMRERAHYIGAKLVIRSAPGEGTEVSVEWRPRGRKD